MPLQLTLSPEIEQRLQQETTRRSLSEEALALQFLDQHLPPQGPDEQASAQQRAAKLLALFEQWDAARQAAGEELGDDFYRGLDEARTSDRKLFPEELKGITW
jgi:hypothetical protein